MARKRLLGGFEVELLPQSLIAETGGVLISDAPLGESLVGDGKSKIAIFRLGIDDAVEIIPAATFQLKTEILDLGQCFLSR